MFNITFDDATFVVQNRSTALPLSPLTNPYHHMFFANGFVYMPDSWEPYPSISQPNVAMVLPFGAPLLKSIPFAGSLLPGEFGAGPRAAVSAYWFNAHSGYFGCALNGITPCTLRISGYRYDPVGKKEVLAAEQTVSIPACPLYIGCKLMRVDFNEGFTGLSGIQFNAYTGVLNVPQVFMMDSLGMEWWNNTCEAGILRIGHR
ncbi:hypothetical protein CC78DRAFT_475391 [Lojkania enalia]|uniref:DUF7371 domain-containing protein n=1 Tax=Lojkania enalia TaxID=147567 RepID=A0A9P4K3G6_9PLEO|nr:hypothetical protein CC78DRAFT_475391 [Didymosphaeria enalia]